jgi:LysM repeat protein
MGIKPESMKKYTVLIFLSVFLLTGPGYSQDPLKQMRSNVIEKINGQDYYIHTVKRGQTLYMISKAYGVDVNDVIRENPEVKEGINSDMKLKIPVPQSGESQKKIPVQPAETPKEKTKEVTMTVPEKAPEPEPPAAPLPCGKDKSSKKETYHVALMLPLFLDEVTQMDGMSPDNGSESGYQPLKFIQFYEGFLVALDSLSKQGMKVKVFVYDVDKDTVKTTMLLRKPEFRDIDLIVGLLYPRNFQIVAEFAAKNNINIINPLSEREQLVKGNPRVFKVMPSASCLQANLLSFLTANFRGGKIIIVNPPVYPDKNAAENLKKSCLGEKMDVVTVQNYAGAVEQFSKENENVLIIFSENKAGALDLITKLNEKRTDSRLTVIGMPRWDKLDELETDYLVNLRTHVFAPYFVDLWDTDVIRFILKYQDRYGAIPEDLAFQGFDVAYYFLTALNNYGKSFERCIPELTMKSLQTSFRFSRPDAKDGYENQYWSIYKYENYKMVGVAH